jgi:hypothetical protein
MKKPRSQLSVLFLSNEYDRFKTVMTDVSLPATFDEWMSLRLKNDDLIATIGTKIVHVTVHYMAFMEHCARRTQVPSLAALMEYAKHELASSSEGRVTGNPCGAN